MDRMLSQESQPDILGPQTDRPDIHPDSTGSSSPAGHSGDDTPDNASGKDLSGGRLSTGASPDHKSSTDSSAAGRSRHSGRSGRRHQTSRTSRTHEPQAPVSAGSWFVTLMCMNIPIIGWFYLIILAFSKSAGAKRGFARAYILYKFIFLLITLAILAVALHYGLEFLDKVLAYMEML